MATFYWDLNATGGNDGLTKASAFNDPAKLLTESFTNSGGDVHIFARGVSAPQTWDFTTHRVVNSGAGKITIRSEDFGNGGTYLPRFRCIANHGTVGAGWQKIDAAVAAGDAGSLSPVGTGNLWHTTTNINSASGFVGAFRGGDGVLFWGQRTKMKSSDNGGTVPLTAPDEDYMWGTPSFGGLCLYLTAGNPNTFATILRRPSGATDSKILTFANPTGGLDISGIEFYESDFALNVTSTTAGTKISNVWIHDNRFSHCRKGIALIGNGSVYNRNGAGYNRPIIERNVGYNLGNQMIHCFGSPAMNGAKIRNNICRYNNQVEGAGTIYMDSAYTDDGTWIDIYGNWIDHADYDGRFWLDGSAFYSELGSAQCDWHHNLITNTEVGCHLNIGTGSHRLRNNVARGVTGKTSSEAFVRIVNANLTIHPLNMGAAEVYGNIVDRFGLFAGVIGFDFTGTATDQVRFYIHHNIAKGRKVEDSNFLYPIQGNAGFYSNVRMSLRENNFSNFTDSTTSLKEYSSPFGTSADSNWGTTRLSDTAILAALPTVDATRDDMNYASLIPGQAFTTNPITFNKSALTQG